MTQAQHPEDASHSLVQYFGLRTGVILFISSIIGSGVYKKVAPMSQECESPLLILLAWALAGGVTLLGVLSLAEIAMLMPRSGGPFVYLHEIYGPKVAYAYGWSSFACIQTASTAAIAYVFAQSVNAVVPLPVLGGEYETFKVLNLFVPFANLGVKLTAVGLILALTYINCLGVRHGGGFTNVVTIVVVISLALIVLVNFSFSGGSMGNLTSDSTSYPPEIVGKSMGMLRMLFITMLASFWAYEGWINVGFVGDEIKNPQHNIPRILILGTLGIIGIYLSVNASYLYAVPIDEMIKIAEQENSVAAVEVIRKFLGEWGALGISLLIILTTAGCTNATILTSGRVYYAMAKNGLFFSKAAHVDPNTKVPTNALWIFSFWSCVLVFSGSFDDLTDMLVFSQFIFYALVVAGVFVLRKQLPAAARPYRVIGYPIVPLLYLLFCAGLLVNTLVENPRNAGIGLFLIALGSPFYIFFRRSQKSASV